MKMASGIGKGKGIQNMPMKIQEEVQEPPSVQDEDPHGEEEQP